MSFFPDEPHLLMPPPPPLSLGFTLLGYFYHIVQGKVGIDFICFNYTKLKVTLFQAAHLGQ